MDKLLLRLLFLAILSVVVVGLLRPTVHGQGNDGYLNRNHHDCECIGRHCD